MTSVGLTGVAVAARPGRFRHGLRRVARHGGIAALAVVVAALAGVLPYDTWRNQSRDLSGARNRLSVLDRENAQLSRQKHLLETDAEVARIARQELGLAPAGADVYAIPNLRPGDATLTGDAALPTPARPVPPESARRDRSTFSRLMDAIEFWR